MIIIDGSHLLHRCLHIPELAELQDSFGNPTGGIHGFLRTVSNLCYDKKLTEGVIVAFDNGVPVHRRELYKEYKPAKTITYEDGLMIDEKLLSTLNKTDPLEWPDQVDATFMEKYQFTRAILHNIILPNLGCISVTTKNCEADDIISVICKTLSGKESITILSSDRDLNQLLDDDIEQYDGIKKEYMTKESVIQKYKLDEDVWREEWLIGKALLGDGSDGIPGFKNIGEVAARAYAKQLVRDKGMPLTKLVRAPRTSIDGLQNVISDPDKIWTNYNLMDLNYIFENKPEFVKKIKSDILKSNLFDIDEYVVNKKLDELQMVKAKEFIINIQESNYNSDIKDHLKYFA